MKVKEKPRRNNKKEQFIWIIKGKSYWFLWRRGPRTFRLPHRAKIHQLTSEKKKNHPNSNVTRKYPFSKQKFPKSNSYWHRTLTRFKSTARLAFYPTKGVITLTYHRWVASIREACAWHQILGSLGPKSISQKGCDDHEYQRINKAKKKAR